MHIKKKSTSYMHSFYCYSSFLAPETESLMNFPKVRQLLLERLRGNMFY